VSTPRRDIVGLLTDLNLGGLYLIWSALY
jgi:hypothetical protein